MAIFIHIVYSEIGSSMPFSIHPTQARPVGAPILLWV